MKINQISKKKFNKRIIKYGRKIITAYLFIPIVRLGDFQRAYQTVRDQEKYRMFRNIIAVRLYFRDSKRYRIKVRGTADDIFKLGIFYEREQAKTGPI